VSAILDSPTAASAKRRWTLQPLAEVADILDSKRVPVNSKEREGRSGAVPYYGATGQVGWIDDWIFEEELVLLGEDGAPFLDSSKPKAYCVRGKAWVNNHAHVLRATVVPSGWLLHYLNAIEYRELVTGTTRLKLTQAEMRKIQVPVASQREMAETVAEIEKQFSRLDEAVANLQRVKANLKRYKAALLSDAVAGELAGERNAWKATVLGDVAASVRNGYSQKPDAERGTPILRISAVRPLELNTADVRFLSGALSDYESFMLTANDVLFTRYNGSRDFVGVCAQVPVGMRPTIYPDKLIRVRVRADVLLPAFLVIAASTGEARGFIESRIRTTAGQAGISGGDLKALPLRVPPLAEQHRIVAEVDRRLSIVREVESEVDSNLKRAQALRQAVLARAFQHV
jgi:type I restriction enzyme, S subunit